MSFLFRFIFYTIISLTFNPVKESIAINLDFSRSASNTLFHQTSYALKNNGMRSSPNPWLWTSSLSYVSQPITMRDEYSRVNSIISSLTTLSLGGAYLFNSQTQLSLNIKALQTYQDQISGTFISDTEIDLLWKFFENSSHAIALHPRFIVPTGSHELLSQNHHVGSYLGLNVESLFKSFQTAFTIGYFNHPGSVQNFSYNESPNFIMDFSEGLRIALGIILPVTDQFSINVESFRYQQFQGDQHPNEVYLGLRYHRNQTPFYFFSGLSSGGLIDETSNDYRISLGFKYRPTSKKVTKKIVRKTPSQKRKEVLRKERIKYGERMTSLNLYFANNSSQIVKTFKQQLKKLKSKLNDQCFYILEGFASRRGEEKHNFILSEERAKRVAQYLISLGVKKSQIKTVAYGDARAIEDIDEALNRKVMIRIYR